MSNYDRDEERRKEKLEEARVFNNIDELLQKMDHSMLSENATKYIDFPSNSSDILADSISRLESDISSLQYHCKQLRMLKSEIDKFFQSKS
tara:strand:- start:6039 stop:6311 length:273 start_codon:yes stop_codon:yes gene_type:complete